MLFLYQVSWCKDSRFFNTGKSPVCVISHTMFMVYRKKNAEYEIKYKVKNTYFSIFHLILYRDNYQIFTYDELWVHVFIVVDVVTVGAIQKQLLYELVEDVGAVVPL